MGDQLQATPIPVWVLVGSICGILTTVKTLWEWWDKILSKKAEQLDRAKKETVDLNTKVELLSHLNAVRKFLCLKELYEMQTESEIVRAFVIIVRQRSLQFVQGALVVPDGKINTDNANVTDDYLHLELEAQRMGYMRSTDASEFESRIEGVNGF